MKSDDWRFLLCYIPQSDDLFTLEGNGVSVTKGNIDSKTWSKVQAARKQILNDKVKVAESVSDLK